MNEFHTNIYDYKIVYAINHSVYKSKLCGKIIFVCENTLP